MKRIGLVIGVLAILALLPGGAKAECVRDCLLTYSTCLTLCSQTGKGDDAACTAHCQKGRDGCIERCEANNRRSENSTDHKKVQSSAANDFMAKNIVLASGRDDNDQPCVVGGKYVGNCSLNKPYYNAFNGKCFATLSGCGGSSSCVRCGN